MIDLATFLSVLAENSATLEFKHSDRPKRLIMKVTIPVSEASRIEIERFVDPWMIGTQGQGGVLAILADEIGFLAAHRDAYMEPLKRGTKPDSADGTRQDSQPGGTLHNASPRSDP
jgi:hypothetical protein